MPATASALLVALEGPSGVGKSRLARLLFEATPGALLVEEAWARLTPRPSLAVPDRPALLALERRLLAEERRRYRAAVRARAAGRTVFLDTGFLGPLTYAHGIARLDPRRDAVEALRRRYRSAGRDGTVGAPDRTFYLAAGPRTVARRVAADRLRAPDPWADRHAAVGRLEEALWRGPLRAALGPRLVLVAAGGPSGRVLRTARAALARPGGPGALRPTEARALLARAVAAVPPGRSARVKKRARRAPPPRR